MAGLYTIDFVIVVLLILGALFGLKKGIVKSVISLFGVVLVFIIAWNLKNPIVQILFTKLPFFNITSTTSIMNIVIYELIAFLLIAIILLIILKLIMIFTGLIDKILSITKVMGFASKLLGMIFGFIEMYVLIFFVLFFLYNFTNIYKSIDNNTLALRMLNSTPILSTMVENERATFDEITSLKDNYKENDEEYNKKVFETLIKYNVLKPKTAQELVNSGKVKIDGAEEIIKKYE